jgi:hypothetical protein
MRFRFVGMNLRQATRALAQRPAFLIAALLAITLGVSTHRTVLFRPFDMD